MNLNRTWTDDDLRSAVKRSHSWRGVMRELGLRATSSSASKTVQRHAERLGLDSSHFTGQRRWSETDLKAAVAGAETWADVLHALGLSERGVGSLLYVKGHAARLELPTDHLELRQRRPLPDALAASSVQDGALKSAALSIIMAWTILRGWRPSMPVEPAPYDLLLDVENSIYRTQVKSATAKQEDRDWCVGIGRNAYLPGEPKRRYVPYDPDELDLFTIVDGDLKIFMVPSREVAGITELSLGSCAQYLVGSAASLVAHP